ncbi:hypothetical protein DFJ73DRAFT_903483 [Zopfochytrium polystomum]|nr:hypothetical protein DFJ73DRAFT_903483 [Zopfochytrium polystomum]
MHFNLARDVRCMWMPVQCAAAECAHASGRVLKKGSGSRREGDVGLHVSFEYFVLTEGSSHSSNPPPEFKIQVLGAAGVGKPHPHPRWRTHVHHNRRRVLAAALLVSRSRTPTGSSSVYSVTDRRSLDHAFRLLAQARRCGGYVVPAAAAVVVVVGNKADIVERREVSEAEGRAAAQAMGACAFLEASAKDWGRTEQLAGDSDGFVFMYSVASRASFDEEFQIQKAIARARDWEDGPGPLVLVGCMAALGEGDRREAPEVEGSAAAKAMGAAWFGEASAKTGVNVDEAIYALARCVRDEWAMEGESGGGRADILDAPDIIHDENYAHSPRRLEPFADGVVLTYSIASRASLAEAFQIGKELARAREGAGRDGFPPLEAGRMRGRPRRMGAEAASR